MSTLLLVRHGQARAFEADSDRLTERGEEQARAVGEHLVSLGAPFDVVISGTLTRQRRTQEIVGDRFRAAGVDWPEPSIDAAWNEYAADGILGTLMPALALRDAAFAERVQAFQAASGGPERNRFFQRMFERLMAEWERGSITHPDVESFAAFHGRVSAAFDTLTRAGGNRRIALFTSGGPIGVSVQRVLEAPEKTALRLNWRVKNASFTEFLFSEGRVSLDSFNGVEHLPTPLRTFR
jgi:broad specificity phosphatase PhoE